MKDYSFTPDKEEKTAKSIGREIRVSPKFSAEICREIKGKKLDKAKKFLEDLIAMKVPLPLKKYKGGVSHKKGLRKAYAGRYPVKAASKVLRVLANAEANAEYKGLDAERLYIRHVSTNRGRVIKRFMPRAFGKSSPHNTLTSNIQVILEER